MEGGELFQRIQDRAEGAFTERGNNFSVYNKTTFKISKSTIGTFEKVLKF